VEWFVEHAVAGTRETRRETRAPRGASPAANYPRAPIPHSEFHTPHSPPLDSVAPLFSSTSCRPATGFCWRRRATPPWPLLPTAWLISRQNSLPARCAIPPKNLRTSSPAASPPGRSTAIRRAGRGVDYTRDLGTVAVARLGREYRGAVPTERLVIWPESLRQGEVLPRDPSKGRFVPGANFRSVKLR